MNTNSTLEVSEHRSPLKGKDATIPGAPVPLASPSGVAPFAKEVPFVGLGAGAGRSAPASSPADGNILQLAFLRESIVQRCSQVRRLIACGDTMMLPIELERLEAQMDQLLSLLKA